MVTFGKKEKSLKEYALIQLISDSSERETALSNLNQRYNAERRQAALEYAALLADIALPVFKQENIQQAATDIDLLTQKLREYSAAGESDKPQILEELNQLTTGMDEGSAMRKCVLPHRRSSMAAAISRM